MTYVKTVQAVVDKLTLLVDGTDEYLHVGQTFPDDPKSSLSCIVHVEGTDRFGIIGVSVEDFDEDVNFFVFNGKMYDYCKAEGFSRTQMIEDYSFENKVLIKKTEEEFIEFIVGN